MIVIPIAEDQHGNAARVVYHGVGLRADLGKLTVKRLQDLVEIVDKDPYIRLQSTVWSRKCQDTENAKLGTSLIETFLKGPLPSFHRHGTEVSEAEQFRSAPIKL